MDILQLDEAQGLTAEMVFGHLAKTGWRLSKDKMVWEHWHGKLRDGFMRADVELGYLLKLMSAPDSPQLILRAINPRMRKGIPSRAALEAHSETGDWISSRTSLHCVRFVWIVNDFVQMIDGCDVFSTERAEDLKMMEECSFWPC